jgi:WD40 repeat protein
VVGVQSGKCLQVKAGAATLELGTCNGGANQKWARSTAITSIKGSESNRCLDVLSGGGANNSRPGLWDCATGNSNQSWTLTGTNQLAAFGTRCLDVAGSGTADGTAVVMWDCGTGNNQQWTVNPDGTIVSVSSGKCLDAVGHGTPNNTLLDIWTCNGGANQKWTRS